MASAEGIVKPYMTKKPSEPTIARSGASFQVEWKIGDKDYGGGQTLQYKTRENKKYTAWKSVSGVGKTDTKAAVKLNANSYYPNANKPKLTTVAVRVCGRRADFTTGTGDNTIRYKTFVSDFTEKRFAITAPAKPSVSSSLSETYSNITTFSYSSTDSASAWRTVTQWETKLIKNCGETNGEKAWKLPAVSGTYSTGTGGASGSHAITENTATLAQGTYTRWFRVRSRGPAGDSAWVYAKHVYANPFQAVISTATAKPINTGYTVTLKWSSQVNAAKPIDSAVIQYAFATPAANLACGLADNAASWQDVDTVKASSGAYTFYLDTRCGTDQCLFVRVNNIHDRNTTYGPTKRVAVGALATPTDLSASLNTTTHIATITATNNSAVPDSFLAVKFMTSKDPTGFVIGIIPHGSSAAITPKCPTVPAGVTVSFGVYAVQGTYTATTRADGVSSYAVKANAVSPLLKDGGTIPLPPGTVTLTQTDTPGTVQVTWTWSWSTANAAEISWADHADAWESTDEPETYTVDNSHLSKWNISGLETGVTWYIRVRLVYNNGDEETFGPYSDIKSIDLASAPVVPALSVSNDGVLTVDGTIIASWVYMTSDGTQQAFAEVAEIEESEYSPIAQIETAQAVTIYNEYIGWEVDTEHQIAVRVMSGSGKWSEWSDPVTVHVANLVTASITSDSLEPDTIVVGDVSRNINALTEMPLTVTTSGAGDGTTTVVIERAEDYHVARPDESERYGYAGETIAILTQDGDGTFTFTPDTLMGDLDDGAPYRIVVTCQDSYGQTAETSKNFEVRWDHQAIIPEASVEIDPDNMVAKLTPIAPDGADEGDTCDIYRLSVDKPVLVYPGAEFGETYVDPFPTIGEFGGHRFVFRTANGDYITEDNTFAWIDTQADEDDILEREYNIIDFGSGRVALLFEIDLSNSWSKDFTETEYLGGSVQGDWNPAVKRSSTLQGVAVAADDAETIEAMRRLAEHTGICHIRTKDGSSFAADVQVSESYKQQNNQKLVNFSLKITRVDPEGYDGLTLAEWEETQEEEE